MRGIPSEAFQTAKERLREYDFEKELKSLISQRLDHWERNYISDGRKRTPLDLDVVSKFSLVKYIRQNGVENISRSIAEIAVLLLVCEPAYPEVRHYLEVITTYHPLIIEWKSFATSRAWEPFRQRDPGSVTEEGDSVLKSIDQHTLSQDEVKYVSHSTPMSLGTFQNTIDHQFPLLAVEGELRGYTALTTIRPLKWKNLNLTTTSPLTLRVGWHKRSGAAVVGLMLSSWKFAMYAAACTLDERYLPVGRIRRHGTLRMDEVVFINDFGSLDASSLASLIPILISQGPSDESLGSIISRLPELRPASPIGLPLREHVTMSTLSYGDGPAFPKEIADHADEGREFTGILAAFRPKLLEFHKQVNVRMGHRRCRAEARSRALAAPSQVPGAMGDQVVSGGSYEAQAGATAAELDELFKLAQSFVDKYLEIFPGKRSRLGAHKSSSSSPRDAMGRTSTGAIIIGDDEENDVGGGDDNHSNIRDNIREDKDDDLREEAGVEYDGWAGMTGEDVDDEEDGQDSDGYEEDSAQVRVDGQAHGDEDEDDSRNRVKLEDDKVKLESDDERLLGDEDVDDGEHDENDDDGRSGDCNHDGDSDDDDDASYGSEGLSNHRVLGKRMMRVICDSEDQAHEPRKRIKQEENVYQKDDGGIIDRS